MDIKKQSICPFCDRIGGCNCNEDSFENEMDCLEGHSLAMVYSPCQKFENLYEAAEALKRGTVFTALDMPFLGGKEA